jgi:hypothetical protein
VRAVLAYVFWHAPAPGTARGAYESGLAAFHAVLVADPPPGFRGSVAVRLDAAPWAGGPVGYEDWYLVDDWTALGTLNAAAVAGARRAPHDVAAAMAGTGSAGVYAPVRGAIVPPREPHAAWLSKPAGLDYDDLLAALGDGPAWQRQMTLGPAPEFCLLGAEPPAPPWPHTPVGREPVT